jgi:hypothetical protein
MRTTPLRISPQPLAGTLTPQQERFNALVQDVAAARATLAAWQDRIERSEVQLAPLRQELHVALRGWVAALDAASLQPGLSRGERGQLSELVQEATAELRDEEDEDENDDAPAANKPAPPPNPPSEDDEPWRAAAEAAAAERQRRAAHRRATSKQKHRAKETVEASQSLRDVYRKLASALHPDREPDPQERERKTALMQHANQAYASNNLLALLEMQLQAEQIDMARLASLDQRRLAHYITVLQEQLAELQQETRKLETWFRAAMGASPGSGMPARKADRMITAEAQRLRGDLELLAQQTKLLRDPDETKEWLRALRQSSA